MKLFECPGQLFADNDSKTPTGYARTMYNETECGVWTVFILRDGGEIVSDKLTPQQDTLEWATRHVVGVIHGSIVEGSDATFQADPLLFPFSDSDLVEALDYLEGETDAAWHEAHEN